MKKIKNWFLRNKHTLTLSIFFIFIIALTVLNNIDKVSKADFEYNDKFNLSEVPAGLIIWKHGVPNTYKEFVHADSTMRYEYFDIGILSKSAETIYCVRVPYNAVRLFQLGGTINIGIHNKNNQHKRNLRPNYYVQPYEIIKKQKKLTNL